MRIERRGGHNRRRPVRTPEQFLCDLAAAVDGILANNVVGRAPQEVHAATAELRHGLARAGIALGDGRKVGAVSDSDDLERLFAGLGPAFEQLIATVRRWDSRRRFSSLPAG